MPAYSRRPTPGRLRRRAAAARWAAEIARSVSRRSCFSRSVCRLSYSFLPLRQRDLDLRPAVLEVQGEGHDRVARLLGLRTPACRSPRGAAAACACGAARVVGPRALAVLGDVDVVQPRLAAVDLDEAVDQRGPALAQRLHLGAGEHETGLVGVEDRGSRAAPSCSARSSCARLFLSHSAGHFRTTDRRRPEATRIPSGPAARHGPGRPRPTTRSGVMPRAVDAAAGRGAVVARRSARRPSRRAAGSASAPSPCRRCGSRRRPRGRGPGGRR